MEKGINEYVGSCVFFNRGSILLIKFICIERKRYLLHYQTKDDLEKHQLGRYIIYEQGRKRGCDYGFDLRHLNKDFYI